MKRKIATIVLASTFLLALFGGLFNLSSGMNLIGSSDMSGCLFMDHAEALCSMGVLDHLAAWQSNFLALIPTLTMLLVAAAATAVFFSITPSWWLRKRTLRQEICIADSNPQVLTFPKRPLQELFSSGILHPKLF